MKISASVGFYCKEVCYDARSYERKIPKTSVSLCQYYPTNFHNLIHLTAIVV